MTVILEARDLVKRYPVADGEVEALRGVSLQVNAGEFVAIMGTSGSGKSTMLHLLGGLDSPTSGEVVIDGIVISSLDEERRTLTRRDKTGFVFQFFNLIPLLSVAENVALPFLIAGDSTNRHTERVGDLLAMVGLADKADHRPDQLSAGEQQRVALARALATKPAILLADEPTGNLDYTTGAEILDLLWDSADRLGQTVVLVTHDARAAAYADRVLVVRDGQVRDEIALGRRRDHQAGPLIARLAELGL
ncbi:MAG: ABC transporter ATP-binding protein [Chloroflexi bacterium]|nr:ABC transporter ATP-binding protein [Chloroflexota bacterium]